MIREVSDFWDRGSALTYMGPGVTVRPRGITIWNVSCGDKMGLDGTLPIMGKVYESDTIGLKG